VCFVLKNKIRKLRTLTSKPGTASLWPEWLCKTEHRLRTLDVSFKELGDAIIRSSMTVSQSDVIRTIKINRVRSAGHVARTGVMKMLAKF
jgi:hypothetical protein